jgi:hypothetical protein
MPPMSRGDREIALADRLQPPQVAEMSCYLADGEITSICAVFLVVATVSRNRSPQGEFPACREKGREFSGFWLIGRKTVSEITVLSGRYG